MIESQSVFEKKMIIREQNFEVQKALADSFAVADTFLTQGYLDHFSRASIINPESKNENSTPLRFFEVFKIVYDANEEINDKLISVYSSLHQMDAATAIKIRAEKSQVRFYVATRSSTNPKGAGDTLCSVLKGNFPGIDLSSSITGQAKDELLHPHWAEMGYIPKSLATVSLIPSERDDDKQKFIQGIEKFIMSLSGKTYEAILLATPVSDKTLAARRYGFEELYSHFSPHGKTSLSFAQNYSTTVNRSISSSLTNSVNRSISNSSGTSSTSSSGTNSGANSGFSFSGDGSSASFGSSSGSFSSYSSGSSFTETVSEATSAAKTQGTTDGRGSTEGTTETVTLTFENKSVQTLMNKAEAELNRIDFSESYGMWDYCAYFFSDDIAVTTQAANVYKSTMIGQESSVEKAHVNLWGIDQRSDIGKILNSVFYLQHPVAEIPAHDQYKSQRVMPTNMVNGKELPIVLGLPRKSVPGLAVIEMAEFGRTVVFKNPERVNRLIDFGSIYHMGIKENLRVTMDVDLLASHCFITGSSGSGKSYATYQLLSRLHELGVKLLIIEPVKGEYKEIFGGVPDIGIYTADTNAYKMLKINPFRFPQEMHVLTHIERLMQIFNASWELHSAMPAILKNAVVEAYKSCGWDVLNSIWLPVLKTKKYPTFKDVLRVLPRLIDESDFSGEVKGNYKGALIMRVSSMTVGIPGIIFGDEKGIDPQKLFENDSIIDLSDLGSEETIALIMGVVIMQLNEYRQSERKRNKITSNAALRHVTVLEEAHNLLKRTNTAQSQESANIVGKSVEMISNSIKEMRTYGEGFIIIDQSPMAVDESAIENTSTKLVFNIPGKDACEEMSSSLSLNDEQTRELSRLNTGVAVVFQKGWLTPVLIKVDDLSGFRYTREVQMVNLQDIRKLKGDLVSAIVMGFDKGKALIDELTEIIVQSTLSEEKKEEYRDIIQSFACALNCRTYFSLRDVGKTLLRIADIQGMLDVLYRKDARDPNYIARKIAKDENWINTSEYKKIQEEYVLWFVHMLSGFECYVEIEEKPIIVKAMLYIILVEGDKGDNNRYSLFSKWENLMYESGEAWCEGI